MKHRTLLCLTILAVFLLSAPAEAKEESWERIATTPQGEVISLDTSSIKTDSDGAREAWFRHEYNPPNCTAVEEQCISEITEHRRLYPDKTTCSLYVYVAFTDASFSTHNLTCKIEKVTPGSAAENMWNQAFR